MKVRSRKWTSESAVKIELCYAQLHSSCSGVDLYRPHWYEIWCGNHLQWFGRTISKVNYSSESLRSTIHYCEVAPFAVLLTM
jgi:hypothetical protein